MIGLLRTSFALPILLIIAVILVLFTIDPLSNFGQGIPPEEALVIERVTAGDKGLTSIVRGNSRDPVTIAQVQIDGAYWKFKQIPPEPLKLLSQAKIVIPYPWVSGESHHMRFVSSNGTTFDYALEVARKTPNANIDTLFNLLIIGLFVGLVPVSIGMMTLPILRNVGNKGIIFAMTLTIGLLTFLLVDTLSEGLQLAQESASSFRGEIIVWMIAALTFFGTMAISRKSGLAIGGATLSTWLALGMGLHNFGEGLSVGFALSMGNAALGSTLIIGFMIHNLTEGVAIVAPVARNKISLMSLCALALIAGLPAVAGTFTGAFILLPHWGALFFGIAAGAIAQVIVEVGRSVLIIQNKREDNTYAGPAFAGFGIGVVVMYLTGFLVQV